MSYQLHLSTLDSMTLVLVCLSSTWPDRILRAEERESLHSSAPADYGLASQLPLPSQTPIAQYETLLFRFLNERQYVPLGWRGDKRIRDTGPLINRRYYGTHPAARVFYSPEVITWLVNGRQGTLPDGAMIIKEQYATPATRHDGKSEEEIWNSLNAWTIMVKDSQGSYDGWFWSNPQKNEQPEGELEDGYVYPVSGFGLYCLRCHSSTQSPGELPEFTFASLRNVTGFSGEPILFRVDDSWINRGGGVGYIRRLARDADEAAGSSSSGNHPVHRFRPRLVSRGPALSRGFLGRSPSISARPRSEVLAIPPASRDWVARAPRHRVAQQAFVTSNQCMSCHAALSGEFGPTMMHYTTPEREYGKPGRDYSPYGEWRWTAMGLAGRDPIFYAQMDTELALLKREFAQQAETLEALQRGLVETCMRCHGVMGKHQWDLDHAGSGAPFTLDHVYATAGRDELPHQTHAQYGALARDGISCVVCHRMQPRDQPESDPRPPLQYFLATATTGNITLGPRNEIYGPFKDDELAPYAMEHALGFTPKHHPYIQSSQMCGTCHTVSLPIVHKPYAEGETPDELTEAEPIPVFQRFKHHVEQATYLEWLNSEYENEYHVDNPHGRSCQDCHMSRDLRDARRGIAMDKLPTRIAIIQDETYPEAENLAPHEKLRIRIREEGYARHNFSGLNLFLLEMFRQFDDILGVPKQDFMTGIEQIPDAESNFLLTAREKTASLEVAARRSAPRQLEARVTVVNKAGHRFPSGVGFRRAFIEFLVLDESKPEQNSIVWSSGRTNEHGVLINQAGEPLPTEFFDLDLQTGKQRYQPHHDVITSSEEVQIYETLLHDRNHEFTTSFVRGGDTVKDNRLLPRGWRLDGRHPDLKGGFLQATYPDATTLQDPRYVDGSGSDELIYRVQLPDGIDPARIRVRATLYYQAIPPYFLKSLFETAPDAPATQRLHYICSHITLKSSAIEDWKLEIVSQQAAPDPASPEIPSVKPSPP